MKITKSKLLTLSLFLVLSACKNFTGSKLTDTKTQIIATYSGGEVTLQDLDYELGKLIAKNEKLKNLTFENLSSDQKEALVKEIALKEIFYKEAKKRGLNKDADYQKALKLFEHDLLQQKLLIALIAEAKDEKNLRKNYAELTEKIKDKKDFRISYIALKTQNEANSLYKSLSKFPSSFAAQAKKKSIDKEVGEKSGDLGFVLEDSISEELLKEIKTLNKDQISKPIFAYNKWILVKFTDERAAEILPYEKIKDDLAQNLSKKAVEDFVSQSLVKAKINVLVK